MSPLYLYNGQLLIENGALASSINCCCSGNPCNCNCYEVSVNGKWGIGNDAYSDPNNEEWSSGFVYNCGSGGASYLKLDYPVRIGGINININGSQAVVTQNGDTGCALMSYEWSNATLTFNSSGCPNGINLGEPTFTCTPIPNDAGCNPIYGDWGGTDEEICQKAQQFLDDHAPTISFRGCSGACCTCPAVIHPYNYASIEFNGPYFWETEEEANSAADDVVGFCEELKSALDDNGYCGATVNIVFPRVYEWTAFFYDPPRTVWSLVTDFAFVGAVCCGTEEGELIGPKWPDTNFGNINDYIFGSIQPCVPDEVTRICVDGVSAANCSDCSTFLADETCGNGACGQSSNGSGFTSAFYTENPLP